MPMHRRSAKFVTLPICMRLRARSALERNESRKAATTKKSARWCAWIRVMRASDLFSKRPAGMHRFTMARFAAARNAWIHIWSVSLSIICCRRRWRDELWKTDLSATSRNYTHTLAIGDKNFKAWISRAWVAHCLACSIFLYSFQPSAVYADFTLFNTRKKLPHEIKNELVKRGSKSWFTGLGFLTCYQEMLEKYMSYGH